MQLTIMHCLPWGGLTTQILHLPVDSSVDALQDMIVQKFNVPKKLQILKFKKDGLTLKLISGWPLRHYGLSEKETVHLEVLQSSPENLDGDSPADMRSKGHYFQKLGLLNKENMSLAFEDMENFEKSFDQLLQRNIILPTYKVSFGECYDFRGSTYSLFKSNVSLVCKDHVETLIKEVKANNLKKILEILIGVDNLAQSIREDYFMNPEEASHEVKVERIINERGAGGWSAFHWGIYHKHVDIVVELVNLGADYTIHTQDNWTPLQLAVYRNSIEIVRFLLKQPRTDVNEVSARGTALHLAVKGRNIQMISLLLENQANTNIQTEEGLSPKDLAQCEKVKKLLQEKPFIQDNQARDHEEVFDKTPLAIIKGFVLKRRSNFPTFHEIYLVLNPWRGILIYFEKERHYPNKPKRIVPLQEIVAVQRKATGLLSNKKLHYIEILKKRKWVLAFKEEDTAEKWISYIERARSYTVRLDLKISQIGIETPNMSLVRSCLQKEENTEEFVLVDGKDELDTLSRDTEVGSSDRNKIDETDEEFQESILENAKEPQENVSLSSFEMMSEIGSGSFGKVYMAKQKETRKIYALKILHKKTLLIKNQLEYAISEAIILRESRHPFIINLKHTFQTDEHLILVLGYCPGGDLSTFLNHKGTFSEAEARIVIAELILAIEYLHSKNILYRDLKPENILIGNDGHIRLTDFGLSKRDVLPGDVTKSFCGSPAYLAPEMLEHEGVGRPVDLYGIGTVLYELLNGRPPYFSEDFNKLYHNIRAGQLMFPQKFSKEVRNLLTKLLEKNPKKRLGALNINDLKNDPFFAKINWEHVYQKKVKPFKIYIKPTQTVLHDPKPIQNNCKNEKPRKFAFTSPTR